MSTTWELLAGDTARFAAKIALQRDPDQGTSATAEESASWGAMELWVYGRDLLSYSEDDGPADDVRWYLISALEWIADCWDPLFHEERLPLRNAGSDALSALANTEFPPADIPPKEEEGWFTDWQAWWRRHDLQSTRDGGLFPQIVLRRWRDRIEVSWSPARPPGVPRTIDFRFLSPQGVARFFPNEVALPLYEVTRAAVAELQRRLPESNRIAALADRYTSLRDASRHDERAAWLAGLGRAHGDMAARWEAIRERLAQLPEAIRQALLGDQDDSLVIDRPSTMSLLFGSVTPTINERDVTALIDFAVNAARSARDEASIGTLAGLDPVPVNLADVPGQAYALAADVIGHLGLSESTYVDVEGVLADHGVKLAQLDLSDSTLRAVTLAGPSLGTNILLNARHRWATRGDVRRFALAHELCHVLFDRSYGQRVAVATGPWAPRDLERRANAFAAAFLMPVTAVRHAAAQVATLESTEGVTAVARTLGVSASAALEHLCNLGLIDEGARDELRQDLNWSALRPARKF